MTKARIRINDILENIFVQYSQLHAMTIIINIYSEHSFGFINWEKFYCLLLLWWSFFLPYIRIFNISK